MNTEQHSDIQFRLCNSVAFILQPDMSHLSHFALRLQITGVFVVSYPHIFHAIRQK